MQRKTYKEDSGTGFGKWTDPISRLMYFDSTNDILSKIQVPHRVADYGGANGNLKKMIPNAISIDIDCTKNPDIIEDILTHVGNYDLIVIRFVLHYLTDYKVLQLFNNIEKYHKGNILVIQFINNDLVSKYKNSKNEFKYFRTEQQTQALLPDLKEIYNIDYTVTQEFYKNRLNIANSQPHKETIKAYYV